MRDSGGGQQAERRGGRTMVARKRAQRRGARIALPDATSARGLEYSSRATSMAQMDVLDSADQRPMGRGHAGLRFSHYSGTPTLVFPVLPVHQSRAASGCCRLLQQAHSHFGAGVSHPALFLHPRRPHHFGPVLPGTLGPACGVGESPHVSHPHWQAAGAPQRSVDRRRRASARRSTGLAPTHSTKPNVPFLLKLEPAETRQG